MDLRRFTQYEQAPGVFILQEMVVDGMSAR